MNWREQALCAQVGPEMFFPDKGGHRSDAQRVCGLCHVRAECLAEALRIGADGIWGGTTPQQRQRLGGSIYASATHYLPPPECGTEAARKRHQRAGQRCATCTAGAAA
jgi:WhiB family redox-sensing transcriptional regulator